MILISIEVLFNVAVVLLITLEVLLIPIWFFFQFYVDDSQF